MSRNHAHSTIRRHDLKSCHRSTLNSILFLSGQGLHTSDVFRYCTRVPTIRCFSLSLHCCSWWYCVYGSFEFRSSWPTGCSAVPFFFEFESAPSQLVLILLCACLVRASHSNHLSSLNSEQMSARSRTPGPADEQLRLQLCFLVHGSSQFFRLTSDCVRLY